LMTLRPTKRVLALLAVVAIACVHILFFRRPRSPPPAQSAFPDIIHHHTPLPPPGHAHWPLLDKLLGPPLLPTKCRDLPVPDYYWSAQDAFTPAFVAIPNPQQVPVGETVCVRVVVPAKPARSSVLYTPMPDMPWDSVLLDLVGQQTNVSVPVHLQMAPDIRNTRRDSVHVYEADVVLRDADEYRARGYIEFRDAEWNPDGGLQPVAYGTEALYVPETLSVTVEDDGTSKYSLARHMELPLCTEADAEGRWVAEAMLPFDAELVAPAENHGLVWLPYACRLRRISYSEYISCLATRYPMMHWYGDSNLRRALKKITTLGEWCSANATHYNSTETRTCLCEDYADGFQPFDARYRELMIDLDPSGGRALTKPTKYADVPAGIARMYLHKWEGLSYRNRPPWPQEFQNGITSRYGHPMMALISLTNWDAAFSSRAYFAVEMQALLDHLAREYTPFTELYVRTGQYYCCRTDVGQRPRSYSRLRNAYFDQYVVDAFAERFGGSHALHVWDVASISERLPLWVRRDNVKCPSNHARAEIVEVENQVLMNAMCNREVERPAFVD
ncbi:hypothetical protein LPJ70_005569, partial [Coemansia sp. RSA 2708]